MKTNSRMIAQRRGQRAFRNNPFDAYGGRRAITGSEVPDGGCHTDIGACFRHDGSATRAVPSCPSSTRSAFARRCPEVTALVPAVAPVHGTTGHDWYAVSKLTAVEIALAVGFDAYAPVEEHRRSNGSVERSSRYRFYSEGEVTFSKGDFVHQPPGIRRRVVTISDDRELLQVTSPADYQTVEATGD